MNRTFDASDLKLMSLFERATRSKLRDFVETPGRMLFIVEQGELGKAIGKGASNVRDLESKLNRKIKIVEFNPEAIQFVRNLIAPLRVDNVSMQDGIVVLESNDVATKSMLIGRNAQTLRMTEGIVKRYFKINEIRVV